VRRNCAARFASGLHALCKHFASVMQSRCKQKSLEAGG
jgi:hypothetical protein